MLEALYTHTHTVQTYIIIWVFGDTWNGLQKCNTFNVSYNICEFGFIQNGIPIKISKLVSGHIFSGEHKTEILLMSFK